SRCRSSRTPARPTTCSAGARPTTTLGSGPTPTIWRASPRSATSRRAARSPCASSRTCAMREARVRSVLMTADTVGGVWTYAIELAAALAKVGVHTTIATMGEAMRPAQRAQAERVPRLDVIESRFRLEWMDDPWSDVERAGEWLLGLEKKVTPDVVQVNG